MADIGQEPNVKHLLLFFCFFLSYLTDRAESSECVFAFASSWELDSTIYLEGFLGEETLFLREHFANAGHVL